MDTSPQYIWSKNRILSNFILLKPQINRPLGSQCWKCKPISKYFKDAEDFRGKQLVEQAAKCTKKTGGKKKAP